MTNDKQYYIPLTIERHLKGYSECENHTDRHEVLWHEWNHNKRWLIQLQQLILPSFPSYSKHDVTHSEAVLHNIEMVLGEENIKELSATDCFLLLHTVYIHDIGMCITDEDRRIILKDKTFQEFLKNCENGINIELRKYAKLLLKVCFRDKDSKEDMDDVLEQKLEVYYAIIYLISEYRRQEHGLVSRERLISWMDQPDKLGVGFSAIEIPRRLFHIVANCASTHTTWDFDAVLDLAQEDLGFAHDYAHPRFIAVLLQLGDALDMDNDRFHPLIKEYLGHMPSASQVHYGKHKAIRELKITNEEISIEADCSEPDELRLIRMECDGIQRVLKNASCHWAIIKPHGSRMALPTFHKTKLLLKGKLIPAELVTARFKISQEKAFQLLKGNSIYSNEGFVFLRELLQNAVDATKMQYFRDGARVLKRRKTGDLNSPANAKEVLSPMDYPIEIDLYMRKAKDNLYGEIVEEDFLNPQEALKGYECGVLVKIRDYATGISAKDIGLIADVGTSYKTKKKEINQMPAWLRPTGNFGVGLQSAFLAGEKLVATTYTRGGERYKITFYPHDRGFDGYINTIPIEQESEPDPYGTCFEIFVPVSKRKLHANSPATWDGADPFAEGYASSRQIRHASELMEQMALYLQKLVGELSFPVDLKIHDNRIKQEDDCIKYYQAPFMKAIHNAGIGVRIGNQDFIISKQITDLRTPGEYDRPDVECVYRSDNGDIYRLDCDKVKLYVWNQEHQVCACFGMKHILELREQTNHLRKPKVIMKTKVFYKGMLVTKEVFRDDANLLEYIDLKHIPGEPLKLSRDGFSQSGYDFLDEIYSKIIKSARDALKHFGMLTTQYEDSPMYMLQNKIVRLLNDKAFEEAGKVIIGCAALTYFAMIDESDEVFGRKGEGKTSFWNELIQKINEKLLSDYDAQTREQLFQTSTLFRMPILVKEDGVYCVKQTSLLEIMNEKNKYMIISKRDRVNRGWNSYLSVFPGDYDGIREKIRTLRNTSEFTRRKDLILELEEISNELLSISLDRDTARDVKWDIKEQVFLKWVLSNVPSMAMVSTLDGDTRVNVLDIEICDSVFLNNAMKNLIIGRMVSTFENEGFQRFSSMTWSGYSYLSLDNPRLSVKFVKRGKLARTGYGEFLVPLTGEQMKEIRSEIRGQMEEYEKEIRNLYEEVYEKIFPFIKERGFKISIFKNKYVRLLGDIPIDKTESEGKSPKIEEGDYESLAENLVESFAMKQTNEEQTTEGQESSKTEDSKLVFNLKIVPRMKFLKKKCREYMGLSIDFDIQSRICNGSAYQNLLNYTRRNAKLSPSALRTERLYYCLIAEMVDAMVEWEKRGFWESLDWEFRSLFISRERN